METIPRIQSLGQTSKNSPPVLPRLPKQLRDEAEQVSSKEETASETSSLCDDLEELYEDLPIDKVDICEVKQQKVCQSVNEMKLH